MERLCDVLEVRRGVTAVIGGGGKTSLLYRLASELRERGMVLVATTTRILPPAHLSVRHDRVFVNQADDWECWADAVRALAAELDCPVAAGSLRRGVWRRVQ